MDGVDPCSSEAGCRLKLILIAVDVPVDKILVSHLLTLGLISIPGDVSLMISNKWSSQYEVPLTYFIRAATFGTYLCTRRMPAFAFDPSLRTQITLIEHCTIVPARVD